ncbi:MAG: hypothetical protein WCT32_04355 [Patescibacteria group bacterium]|jgi:hypothetical protein
MEPEVNLSLSDRTFRFLEQYSAYANAPRRDIRGVSDKTFQSALIYEKFRTALEYQEEHLIFKNAISRIVRRKYVLAPSISATNLFNDLVSELSWSNYLNPETLQTEERHRIIAILERYLILLQEMKSARANKMEVQKIVIEWLACEINEVFTPLHENDLLIDYAYEALKDNLKTEGTAISPEENELQLKIAIHTLVLKPDIALLQYWTIKRLYSNWQTMTVEETKSFARSFDPYFNKVEQAINHPLKTRYYQYIKRNIAPFILLRSLFIAKSPTATQFKANPSSLRSSLMSVYDSLIEEGRKKVWRGTIRALIFICMTKLSLALIIEAPIDRYLAGEVDYLSLTINLTLPILLMLFSGTFVKSPPAKNRLVVSEAISNLMIKDKISDKPFHLTKSRESSSENAFNTVYSLFTVVILVGVIWFLRYLHFNLVSIVLFFLFVSAVSFFSFRIRNIALELAMKRSRDDALTSTLEFIFLPFIRIGKAISERLARANPFILALDFLIEAPLKSIIKIMNSWWRFLSSKKEELEV